MERVNFTLSETGSHHDEEYKNIIKYPFGRYDIEVVVGKNNEFIGITEVKINQDFFNHAQKITPKGYHDVEEYYHEK